MSLKAKWIEFLYRVATGSRKFRNLLTPIGATFYGVFTALFVVVALQVDKWLKLPKLLPKTLNLVLSLPILSLAFVIMGWSVFNFLKVKGTPVPFSPPPKLVPRSCIETLSKIKKPSGVPVIIGFAKK